MFAARIPLSQLPPLCRSLGTMLDSGVPMLSALKTVEEQSQGYTQTALHEIALDIRSGSDLTEAFQKHGSYFPELVVDMVTVAEHTGALPEVLKSLADHYENLIRMRRMLLSAIAWPVFQLVAAILVIAGLILIIGWINEARPETGFDPLGFGLSGELGAMVWLGYCFGTLAAVFFVYKFLVRGFQQAHALHSLLLTIPVVGHCLRSFAIARFSWAYALTQQSGMDVKSSLAASLKATNNAAFYDAAPRIYAAVAAGEDFADALNHVQLFPRQFIEMVRVGEQSGTVPETLERLSPQFEEDARRSLQALTVTFGWVIWSLVAIMIIFLIFRLAMFYVGMINQAASGAL